MPWTYDNPPAVAQNWTDEEQRRCVDAANAALESGATDEEAIFACIRAARKVRAMRTHKVFEVKSFKALDEAKGVFEAIVAVFGNVDRAGDKIVPGAFTESLATWKERGRPIPVLFSHEWDNLDAHIGEVLEAKEVDEGLYVKGQIDLEEEFAGRVFKKMKRGTLAEFSFAYDIVDSKMVNGVRELRKLDLLEVGPCLVGMNPETQLLGVKEGRRNATADLARLQKIHDLCVELGVKCAGADDTGGETEGGDEGEAGKTGKPSETQLSTYAARVAAELIELGSE